MSNKYVAGWLGASPCFSPECQTLQHSGPRTRAGAVLYRRPGASAGPSLQSGGGSISCTPREGNRAYAPTLRGRKGHACRASGRRTMRATSEATDGRVAGASATIGKRGRSSNLQVRCGRRNSRSPPGGSCEDSPVRPGRVVGRMRLLAGATAGAHGGPPKKHRRTAPKPPSLLALSALERKHPTWGVVPRHAFSVIEPEHPTWGVVPRHAFPVIEPERL